MNPYVPTMNAVLTEDGKISLLSELRENAHLRPETPWTFSFTKVPSFCASISPSRRKIAPHYSSAVAHGPKPRRTMRS